MIAMPKKLPLNSKKKVEADSSKRSGLRTRALDIKKECNALIKCQQWAERYNLEFKKEYKLGDIFSDFHGFLSNGNGKISKQLYQKLGVRPLKSLNMNNSFGKKFNNNGSNPMTVDFDHMYVNCPNPKIPLQTQLELKQLKELNLLHLDIIERQADEINAKEKRIKILEEDNKNLQARLIKLERQLSPKPPKEIDGLSQISVKTNFCDSDLCPCCVKAGLSPRNCLRSSQQLQKSPRQSPIKEEVVNQDALLLKKDFSRKCSPRLHCPSSVVISSPPLSQNRRLSQRDGRLRNLNNGSDFEATFTIEPAVEDETLRKTHHSPVQKRLLNDDRPTSPPKKLKTCLEATSKCRKSISVADESITDHSLRSREKPAEEVVSQLPVSSPLKLVEEAHIALLNKSQSSHLELEKKRNEEIVSQPSTCSKSQIKDVETRRIRNEGILTTTDSYYLPTQTAVEFEEVLQEDGEETQVEIPKWRIKPFASLYVMEGTENLEDEIFLKRHAKHEQDERRRKRWDLQRMREQRQYERLKERYECRNSTSGSNSENEQSLWPCAEAVQTIVIEDALPVCAFGQLLAKIYESDFTVPWLVGKSPSPAGHSSRRKKR